jgi:hypothetical protein
MYQKILVIQIHQHQDLVLYYLNQTINFFLDWFPFLLLGSLYIISVSN